jgi:hypothetical protein
MSAGEALPIFKEVILAPSSMAANQTSTTVNVDTIDCYCVQAYWTGSTPVGSMAVNASNDNVNFTTIGTLTITGNSGNAMLNADNPAYSYVQVVYTATSGTGTITITMNGKQR